MYRKLNIPGQVTHRVRWLGFLALAGCTMLCSCSAMLLVALLQM